MKRDHLLLVAGLLAAPGATAQEPEDCEPLTEASVRAVARRYDLDPEQTGWLQGRFRERRLRDPGDLENLPGLGEELREALEAAWCWSSPVDGGVETALRTREDGLRRDLRGHFVRGGFRADLRVRDDAGGERTLRGGLTWERGAWRVAGGTLRTRQGLALLLATPGAEPRGSGLGTGSDAGWKTSLSLEPETLGGLAVRHLRGSFRVEATGILDHRGHREVGARWGAISVGRADSTGWQRAQVVAGAGPVAGSLSGGVSMEAERVSAEVARAGGGTAAAATVGIARGPFRIRLGLAEVGTGFRTPQIRRVRRATPDGEARWFLEGTWRGGPGRFLRVALREEREDDRGAWSKRDRVREIEIGERVVPGLKAGFLWRLGVEAPEGSPAEEEEIARVARFDIRFERRGWRLLLRAEERAESVERSRLTSLRLGRDAGIGDGFRASWEVSGVLAGSDPGGPVLWTYRRRAGGIYGWDRLESGSWLGGWVRLTRSRLTLELSLNSRPGGWEGVAALRLAR